MLGKSKKKSSTDENPFYGLRNQALTMKPEDIGITLDNNEQVFAAVVDMPLPNGKIVTLVCFFDGTVSLYNSTGGGLLGLGQKHESIRKAGGSFLYSAGQTLKFLNKTTQFDLPNGNLAFVYLLTNDGAYKAEYNMSNTQKSDKHIQFLNFLIQNTLNTIRENTNS